MNSLLKDIKKKIAGIRVHSFEYNLLGKMGEDSRTYHRLTLNLNGYIELGKAVDEVVNLG